MSGSWSWGLFDEMTARLKTFYVELLKRRLSAFMESLLRS